VHKNITIAEDAPLMEISASFIRSAIRQGKDMRHFLPQKTWEYLEEMNFYK
jgi:nicotinate-nucleotide adenylyltransferase